MKEHDALSTFWYVLAILQVSMAPITARLPAPRCELLSAGATESTMWADVWRCESRDERGPLTEIHLEMRW